MKEEPTFGDNQGVMTEPHSLTTDMRLRVHKAISDAQGWLPFDQFMAMALYEPGLGYYANQQPKFGSMPQSGSDFVTAPE
jgi:SAM-dependent MidA family methyltransferase